MSYQRPITVAADCGRLSNRFSTIWARLEPLFHDAPLPRRLGRTSVPCSGTKSTLSNIAAQPRFLDTGGMKRTVQVNVKMTEDDFVMLRKAAEKRWPDAVMTNSGIVLALARIAARETLGKSKAKT